MAIRRDAAESAFVERELTSIESTLYKTDFPELRAKALIPTVENYDPGAAIHLYQEITSVGEAEVSADLTGDIPFADLSVAETSQKVRVIKSGFRYSYLDVLRSRMAGRPLDQLKAVDAKLMAERKVDETAAQGHSTTGLNGLLNHASITTTVATNGVALSPLWANKTPDEIVKDFADPCNRIIAATLGIETPDTAILSPERYGYIASTRMGDGSDMTILKFLLASLGWLKAIEPWYYCTSLGTGTSQLMCVYKRDPRVLEQRIPLGYTALPVQEVAYYYQVPALMTTAGVILRKPLAVQTVYGI
jgi:hypothetical protein